MGVVRRLECATLGILRRAFTNWRVSNDTSKQVLERYVDACSLARLHVLSASFTGFSCGAGEKLSRETLLEKSA